MTGRRRRPPSLWIGLITLSAILGISTRRFGCWLPSFVAAYAVDTLWALVAFLGIGLILIRLSKWRVEAEFREGQ